MRLPQWTHPLLLVLLFPLTLQAQETPDPILEQIRALDLTGCVLLFDAESEQYFKYGDSLADSAFTPASTFKIPHALIALETGVVTDSTLFEWDGVDRGWDMWNRDMTFADALHYSAIHLFQQIAPQIGPERMQEWVDQFGYGNQDISGEIDLFWVDGGLRITPRQQIKFLQKMLTGQLTVNGNTSNL